MWSRGTFSATHSTGSIIPHTHLYSVLSRSEQNTQVQSNRPRSNLARPPQTHVNPLAPMDQSPTGRAGEVLLSHYWLVGAVKCPAPMSQAQKWTLASRHAFQVSRNSSIRASWPNSTVLLFIRIQDKKRKAHTAKSEYWTLLNGIT